MSGGGWHFGGRGALVVGGMSVGAGTIVRDAIKWGGGVVPLWEAAIWWRGDMSDGLAHLWGWWHTGGE